ncbi:unnamed protein product [Rotaria sp. Silwood1]|nr:unnamed protein product [Rotaria sp. Silwood1]
MYSLTETITRTAIDISGRLGSLYDGWRDQILEALDTSTMKTSLIPSRSVLCTIQRYGTTESSNLARMIGIEDELRLSTLVNFAPKIGILSIIDYPHSINKYTRCFRYQYLDRKEYLFNDLNQVEKRNETSLTNSSATHIITEISSGIDIVVILQLPPDDKFANDIDAALEKIRDHLQNSLKTIIIHSDVERLFDQILFTTVFSNIPKLLQMNKFLDICRNLNQLKKNPMDCEILRYRLSPIKYFFCEYTGEVIRCFPLQSELRDIFENDLLRAWIILKQTCLRLDENTKSLLQRHLALQLLEAHRLYSQGKVYHENVIRQIQSLIITIRSGQEISADIGQIFRDEPYITWRKNMNDLDMCIRDLQTKVILINDLQRQDFEYCNATDRGIQDGDDETTIEQKNLKPCSMRGEWRSIRRAQIEINSMIRPMLEAMRNMFRTLALWNMESTNVSMQGNPIALARPSAICLSCKRKHRRFGNLWIKIDDTHEFRDECQICRCSPSKHLPIDYELEHTLLHKSSDLNRSGMINISKQLCTAGATFTCFLMNTTQNRESDPFLSGLNRMIDEEAEICKTQNPHYLNDFVHDELKKMKNNYESQMKNLMSNREPDSLSTIYQWIDIVIACPMVAKQIAAVKESRQIIIRQQDYEVPQYSIRTVE